MPSRLKANASEDLTSCANSLSDADFAARYLPVSRQYVAKDSRRYTWMFRSSDSMSASDLDACFGLVEETSSADYRNAAQGWNPDHKRVEMLDVEMRYILIYGEDKPGILAFSSFMLTREDEKPVVYIYEIHLRRELRGSGIGKMLMSLVEHTGRSTGMERSMLTVFTANSNAEEFYRRLGYQTDASSPQERKLRSGKLQRPEYLILSKELGSGQIQR